MNKPYEKEEYFAMAIVPVHIGTGGYRLGRVDMSIVRDVSTEIPKIPATSLTGPARAYTAMQTKKYRWKNENTEYSCAGRGGEGGEKHCGEPAPACPVCIPYGFSKGNYSMQGLAQFFDAHIVFFPVATMIGPVWITSPMMLDFIENEKFKVEDDKFYTLGDDVKNSRLNFGWLVLNKDDNGKGSLKNVKDLPSNVLPGYIIEKIVLVSNKNFCQIVNSNLEIRTSVSIDPATGAAEEGALFTYEAIPRGAILRFKVVYNNPGNFRINNREISIKDPNSSNNLIPATINWVREQVENGLGFFKDLGIGGMNTRGMGRLKILNLDHKGGN